jgi:hypothetical protein
MFWGKKILIFFAAMTCPHHAEGLVIPKVRAKKRLLILDTPGHVESENIKFKIGHRSSNFFQNVIFTS